MKKLTYGLLTLLTTSTLSTHAEGGWFHKITLGYPMTQIVDLDVLSVTSLKEEAIRRINATNADSSIKKAAIDQLYAETKNIEAKVEDALDVAKKARSYVNFYLASDLYVAGYHLDYVGVEFTLAKLVLFGNYHVANGHKLGVFVGASVLDTLTTGLEYRYYSQNSGVGFAISGSYNISRIADFFDDLKVKINLDDYNNNGLGLGTYEKNLVNSDYWKLQVSIVF